MPTLPVILARGPWSPDQVQVRWRDEPYEPPTEVARRADEAVDALRERGSPAHDGLAARLAGYEATPERLGLELQPSRWSLRLVAGAGQNSLTALCVVRREDGRWLAGRRAAWLASWAGRWALGAGGAVEVGESPADTLTRELEEEWRLVPHALRVEALLGLPDGLAMIVGVATVADAAEPVADHEHDRFAWWPAAIDCWPEEADPRLCRMARLLSSA
ncbi:MAG TPA: NUDIX hydrolase [Thermoleophilaceae bacterium]|jgi:ADP-ribose pyrophosphatase YjhB (NUDIX family)